MVKPGPIHYFSSEGECPAVTAKPKKRRRIGSAFEAAKRERLSGHITGPHCLCKRRCTEQLLSNDQCDKLLEQFNNVCNRDEQDSYLSGLIRLQPVVRRRMRRANAEPNDSSYKYVVTVKSEDDVVTEIVICYMAFLSFYGVSNGRMKVLKSSLINTGEVHKDKRGKHTNRPRNLSGADKLSIIQHITSFRSRKSHYSRRQQNKVYLPEDLNGRKMFTMYREKYPQSKASYNSYLKVFNTSFNICFGYPRCDTCSACDTFVAKLKDIPTKIDSTNDDTSKTEFKLKRM